jgi:hypothetical protein
LRERATLCPVPDISNDFSEIGRLGKIDRRCPRRFRWPGYRVGTFAINCTDIEDSPIERRMIIDQCAGPFQCPSEIYVAANLKRAPSNREFELARPTKAVLPHGRQSRRLQQAVTAVNAQIRLISLFWSQSIPDGGGRAWTKTTRRKPSGTKNEPGRGM